MPPGESGGLLSSLPEWLQWIFGHGEAILAVVSTCLVFVLGKIVGQRTKTLYKQSVKEGFADFSDHGGRTYVRNSPVGEYGEGGFRVLRDGIIEISRSNIEGRRVLQFKTFRLDGEQPLSYIPARPEAGGQRFFDVSLEARAINGPHRLRIAFRTYPDQEFIQDSYISVEPDRWQKFGRLMTPAADKHLYFFLESPAQKTISTVQVRKLVLREKLPGLRFSWLISTLKLLKGREQRDA